MKSETTAEPTCVHRDLLKAMEKVARSEGKTAVLELGDPLIDVLVVDGKQVAYAPKPGRVA